MEQMADPGSSQNFWVISALVVFFGLSLLIGILPSRKASKGFLSFMIADKNLPWWAVAGTLFATLAGITTLLGFVGNCARGGLTILWTPMGHAASAIMLALFVVPILVRMKRVTLAEPFGERYDGVVRKITSGLSFFRMVGSVASQIVGIGVVISIFTELDLTGGMLVSAVILVVYVSLGGMYGVAYADTFQGAIIVVFALFVPFYFLYQIGDGSIVAGFHSVVERLPDGHKGINNATGNQIIGWVIVMTVGILLRPELFGRIFSARSAKEGVLTWVVVTNLWVIFMLLIIFIGLIAKVTVPDFQGTNDQYGPELFRVFNTPWLTVFYVIAVMAAAVSTASSSMLGSSSHYVTDFHLPIFYKDKPPTERKVMWVSRFAVVFFTALSTWWALSWRDIISIFQFGYTVLAGGLLVPYVGMFFWPRLTTPAARWSAILGGGTTVLWRFVLQPYKLIPWEWMAKLDPIVPSLFLSIGIALIISYSSRPEYEKVYSFAKAYDLKAMMKWAQDGLTKEKAAAQA